MSDYILKYKCVECGNSCSVMFEQQCPVCGESVCLECLLKHTKLCEDSAYEELHFSLEMVDHDED